MNLERLNARHKTLFLSLREIFQALLVTCLVLLVINQFGSFVFEKYLAWLLVIVVIFGALLALFYVPDPVPSTMAIFDHVFIWVLGVLCVLFVYLRTQDLGWLAYAVSVTSGTLAIIIGYLLYGDDFVGSIRTTISASVSRTQIMYFIVSVFLTWIVIGLFAGFLPAFQIVFGSVLFLFLPGALLTYVLYPANKIDLLERGILSFALSISVSTMLLFYMALLRFPLTLVAISFALSCLCLIVGIYLLKSQSVADRRQKKRGRR